MEGGAVAARILEAERRARAWGWMDGEGGERRDVVWRRFICSKLANPVGVYIFARNILPDFFASLALKLVHYPLGILCGLLKPFRFESPKSLRITTPSLVLRHP